MAQKCEANATNVAKAIKPLLLVRYLISDLNVAMRKATGPE